MIRTLFARLLIFAIPLAALFIVGLLLPPTPYSSGSVLFGQIRKDSLLRHTPSPRIIFVGGSNLSMGLNSRLIADSLRLNPVNTALAAGLGLEYMMRHTLPFVQAGDMVVLVFEYDLFFGDKYKGTEYVPRILFDVNKDWPALLRPRLLPYLPKLAFSHYNPFEYFYPDETIYAAKSFNRYGDAEAHWSLPKQFATMKAVREKNQSVNPGAIREIRNFGDSLAARGARMYVSWPCFMETSFSHNREAVRLIETACKEAAFDIIGTPDSYVLPDSLMFDAHYHPVKQGVDIRTRALIRDLKLIVENNGHSELDDHRVHRVVEH